MITTRQRTTQYLVHLALIRYKQWWNEQWEPRYYLLPEKVGCDCQYPDLCECGAGRSPFAEVWKDFRPRLATPLLDSIRIGEMVPWQEDPMRLWGDFQYLSRGSRCIVTVDPAVVFELPQMRVTCMAHRVFGRIGDECIWDEAATMIPE